MKILFPLLPEKNMYQVTYISLISTCLLVTIICSLTLRSLHTCVPDITTKLIREDDNYYFGKTDCEIESFQFRKILVCQLIERSTITNNVKLSEYDRGVNVLIKILDCELMYRLNASEKNLSMNMVIEIWNRGTSIMLYLLYIFLQSCLLHH